MITEALRGEGARLINGAGEAFMHKYHPLQDLAPRDIVARSIIRETILQQDKFVSLDATSIDKTVLHDHFPTIINTCKSIGINPEVTPIPVVPAAHYSCGGIKVDAFSRTTLDGLYAIGECSHTGLHGANRLASNSLLESIVFSHRAAQNSIVELEKNVLTIDFFNSLPDWNGQHLSNENSDRELDALQKEMQSIMSNYVGIFKTNEGLQKAHKEIKSLYFKIVKLYNANKLSPQICELRNMISVAYVLVNQSLEIKENRGVYYNHNFSDESIL